MSLDKMIRDLEKTWSLDGRLGFHDYMKENDLKLIKYAVGVQRLGHLSNRNCLDPVNGDEDYLDLYENIQKREIEVNPRILEFVDKYFNLQFNLCKALLHDHFAERVDDIKAQNENAERFVGYIIDEVDSNDIPHSDEYLRDLLITFLPSYYGANLIRADLVEDDGLAARMTVFRNECRKYLIKPLGVISKTHKFIANDLSDPPNDEYSLWLTANDLCILFERQNAKNWVDRIYLRLSSLLATQASEPSSSRKLGVERNIGPDEKKKTSDERKQPDRNETSEPRLTGAIDQSEWFQNQSSRSLVESFRPQFQREAGSSSKAAPSKVHTSERFGSTSTDKSRSRFLKYVSPELGEYFSRFRRPSQKTEHDPFYDSKQNFKRKPDSRTGEASHLGHQKELEDGVEDSSTNLVVGVGEQLKMFKDNEMINPDPNKPSNVSPLSVFIDGGIITLEPSIEFPNPIEEVIRRRRERMAKVGADAHDRVDRYKNA